MDDLPNVHALRRTRSTRPRRRRAARGGGRPSITAALHSSGPNTVIARVEPTPAVPARARTAGRAVRAAVDRRRQTRWEAQPSSRSQDAGDPHRCRRERRRFHRRGTRQLPAPRRGRLPVAARVLTAPVLDPSSVSASAAAHPRLKLNTTMLLRSWRPLRLAKGSQPRRAQQRRLL